MSSAAPNAVDADTGSISEPSPAPFWRLVADPAPSSGMWDVQRLHLEFEPTAEVVRHVASGSFDERFGPANTAAADDSIWGGRPDERGTVYLGVELSAPAAPTLIAFANGPSDHRPAAVLVQRSDDGETWDTISRASTSTRSRRHTAWYAPLEQTSARGWRLTAGEPTGRFAWDVVRLRLLHHGREHRGRLAGSGEAGDDWTVENLVADDKTIWGGRAGADDRFRIEVRFGESTPIDRITLEQADRHFADTVTLDRLEEDGSWSPVRTFAGLGPGHNELYLHGEPPELLPGRARDSDAHRAAPLRSPDRRRTFEPFEDRRILVLIASYRDKELPRTVANALAQAAYPEHVRFAICHQYDDETRDLLEPWDDDPRFVVDAVPHSESRGCCWARERTFALYDEEPYVFQIDAHTRFAARWDVRYIDMLESIDAELPVLTTYPPGFRYEDDEVVYEMTTGVQCLRIVEVRPDLTTLQKTEPLADLSAPVASPSIAAGQIFTRGSFVRDVPYDPDVYFAGEEISLAARAFTSGYDLFCPNVNLVWHRYDHDEPKHWEDHQDHSAAHDRAVERLRMLFAGDDDALGRHGLGRARALEAFERHAGIRFDAGARSPGHGCDDGDSSDRERDARPEERRDPIPREQEFAGLDVRIDRGAIEQRDDWRAFVVVVLDAQGREIGRRELHSPDVLELRTDRTVIRDVDLTSVSGYLVIPVATNGHVGAVTYRRTCPQEAK